jgi:hypothetical protein
MKQTFIPMPVEKFNDMWADIDRADPVATTHIAQPKVAKKPFVNHKARYRKLTTAKKKAA